MAFELTSEQEDIINTVVTSPKGTLIKVGAVAGSAKTTTSVLASEALHKANCLYLAYNKSIATEAKEKFPSYVECKTTHSLAYGPIVTHGLMADGNTGAKRKVDWFNYKSIKQKVSYLDKVDIITHLEVFFVSKYLTLEEYIDNTDEYFNDTVKDLLFFFFDEMIHKRIPCTHAFYLKYFHILLDTEVITYDKSFDLLILDEAGDINGVTLEIFKLLPANIKLMVGDSLQNIYSFNHTINGFEELADVGVTKHLTRSFRCSTEIAQRIEFFVRTHIDENCVFLGTDHADKSINNEAIISRTNSGLISYMIDLAEDGEMFNLTRPVKEIFSTMLILINLKPGCKIHDKNYKYLLDDLKTYMKSPVLQEKYSSVLVYIKKLHGEHDADIGAALTTIFKYGAGSVYTAYKFAQKCEEDSEKHTLTLSTAHSSKGLTFDSVELAPDFNLKKILAKSPNKRENEDTEELRLYYVACSRARIQLLNAKYLTEY